jgi:enoyl-CoA hydratase/carnithine racemase
MSLALLTELRAKVREASKDSSVRSVVIAGAGGNFSSGADLHDIKALHTEEEAYLWAREGQSVLDEVEACPKPVLAAIRGNCVAGGLELALACDLRFAAADSRIGQTEQLIGSLAAWGGTRRLPRVVGLSKAKELNYSARLISAHEALHIGLITVVTEDERLDEVIEERCRDLALRRPAAFSESKSSIDRATKADFQANLEADARAFGRLLALGEVAAGVDIFLVSRKNRKQ